MNHRGAGILLVVLLSLASAAPAAATRPLRGSSIVVTSSADSGPGTLRRAMEEAQPGDTITFDPAVFPPHAPQTIAVTDVLPGLGQGYVTIDASDAGVILDGSQLPRDTWIGGIEIVSDGNTIRGLQVVNFTGTGIVVALHGRGNTIGGDRGIGAGPTGQGNLCSGNAYGIGVWDRAANNIVTGNLIGTGLGGAPGPGNRSGGMWITEGAFDNVIGPDNIIAYNAGPGIVLDDFDAQRNTITRNSIHHNGGHGISLWAGANDELAAPQILEYDLQEGTITGFTCAFCDVEVYSDAEDEGGIYEGRTTADGSGFFAFSKGTAFAGPHLTATATDLQGNTSTFSFPTSDTARVLIIQSGNPLPSIPLRARSSRDLEDNRIGTTFNGFRYPEDYDFGLYKLGYKRARTSINSIEGFTDEWSRPELSIDPNHDALFTRLADNGFVTTYVLTFWDKATYPDAGSVPCPRFQTEPEIQRYLEFLQFIVGRFKDRVQVYEIWNEPNNMTCPQWIKVEDYVSLVQRIVPVIRQEYPEAKIKVGNTTGLADPRSEAYLFAVLESNVMPLVDVIGWHPFYGHSPEHTADYYDRYLSIVQEIKDVASAHGFEGEYAVDEMTWRSTEMAHPGDPWTYSQTVAAKYYGRGIVMHLGMDIAAGVAGEGYDQIAPIVHIVRNLNTVMAGTLPARVPVQIQTSATNIVSYTFSSPNDAYLVALWTDGIAAEYDPGITATVTLPLPGFEDHKVTGIDVLHGFEQPLMASEEDGNLVIRDLLVKDYPILLRVSQIRRVFLPMVVRGPGG